MARIEIVWVNDDNADVYLDDELLFDVGYDMFGRGGQSQMLKAIHTLAEKAGWEVITTEFQYDDED